MARYKRFFWSP